MKSDEDRKYTNNEVRQNLLATVEEHKAFISLHQAYISANMRCDENQIAAFELLRQRVTKLTSTVDYYKSIPANDEVCTDLR